MRLIVPAQESEADTLKTTRLFLSSGILWSNAFANYPLGSDDDGSSATVYKPVDTAHHYRPGFLLGADLTFFPASAVALVFGFHYTYSQGEYHSTYTAVSATSRVGYEKLTRTNETDNFIKYNALNIGAGLQVKLYEQVFLSGSFFLIRPLRITRSYSGTTETLFESSSGAVDREVYKIGEGEVRLSEKPTNLSFRIGLQYRFLTGGFPSAFFLFRNFGMMYALPWYGLGYSISLSE